jgi:hypothetical protein
MIKPEPTTLQERLDRMTWDMFQDCRMDHGLTAHQMGISRKTVQARVAREAKRLSAANGWTR